MTGKPWALCMLKVLDLVYLLSCFLDVHFFSSHSCFYHPIFVPLVYLHATLLFSSTIVSYATMTVKIAHSICGITAPQGRAIHIAVPGQVFPITLDKCSTWRMHSQVHSRHRFACHLRTLSAQRKVVLSLYFHLQRWDFPRARLQYLKE